VVAIGIGSDVRITLDATALWYDEGRGVHQGIHKLARGAGEVVVVVLHIFELLRRQPIVADRVAALKPSRGFCLLDLSGIGDLLTGLLFHDGQYSRSGCCALVMEFHSHPGCASVTLRAHQYGIFLLEQIVVYDLSGKGAELLRWLV
jgi:hypothetical protein